MAEDCAVSVSYTHLDVYKRQAMRAQVGSNITRGINVPSLDREKKWNFVPVAKAGDRVEAGDILGTVQETVVVEQKIMVPYGIKGTIAVSYTHLLVLWVILNAVCQNETRK